MLLLVVLVSDWALMGLDPIPFQGFSRIIWSKRTDTTSSIEAECEVAALSFYLKDPQFVKALMPKAAALLEASLLTGYYGYALGSHLIQSVYHTKQQRIEYPAMKPHRTSVEHRSEKRRSTRAQGFSTT